MQADLRIAQAVVDRFQTFKAGRVHLVYRAAHQDDMPHGWAVRDLFQHIFLKPARVEIGQRLVDPDRKDMRDGEDLVPIDIAEMLGFRDAPNNRRMRTAGAPEVEQQADDDPRDYSQFHPGQQGDRDGGGMGSKVGLGIMPQPLRRAQIDKAQDSDNDCRGQRCDGQAVKQRGEEQRRQSNSHRRESTCGGRLRTGVEINRRSCKTPVTG